MGENHNSTGDDDGLRAYITRHMLIGVVLAVVIIIALKIVLGFFEPSGTAITDAPGGVDLNRVGVEAAMPQDLHRTAGEPASQAEHGTKASKDPGFSGTRESGPAVQEITAHGTGTSPAPGAVAKMDAHTVLANSRSAVASQTPAAAHPAEQKAVPAYAPASGGVTEHATKARGAGEAATPSFPVVGMAFVDAVIRPLDHELNRRFYGWRPNDILNFTDNVNNFQLGVLEVTRRTAVILAERISRTGSTASFDRNLENAMNGFMIKSDRYWFPSAESKYKASLKEIRTYFHKLERGEAQFFTRTDNLIPLLMAYQDLLGSSDDNLVKSHEDDGTPVSYFKSDDYFFYAKGVASAMTTFLEAIAKDFSIMMSREGGLEVLHHAIESCHHAMEIDPWIVLNSDLSSVFANHRLNMAAPISHARFYLGVLIKTLST